MKAQGSLASHNPLTTAAAKYGAKKYMRTWFNAVVADDVHPDVRELLIESRAGMLEKQLN